MDERVRQYRDDLLAERAKIRARLEEINDYLHQLGCPGPTSCHGCQVWCDLCGDVSLVCDAFRCARHQCIMCDAPVESTDDIEDGQARCFSCRYWRWHFDFLKGWERLGRAVTGQI